MAAYEQTHKIVKLGQSKGIILKKKKATMLNFGDVVTVWISKPKTTVEPTPTIEAQETHTDVPLTMPQTQTENNGVESV